MSVCVHVIGDMLRVLICERTTKTQMKSKKKIIENKTPSPPPAITTTTTTTTRKKKNVKRSEIDRDSTKTEKNAVHIHIILYIFI